MIGTKNWINEHIITDKRGEEKKKGNIGKSIKLVKKNSFQVCFLNYFY